ncbi:L-aminoadipate-semialdehyde dehydrogenase-phosphopantetheinyl transferase, putative [Phytophthora infestans T30-4]|uniref:holo-[acyl-carrier-protein] synthase n=1 Tax=Phytophthora infestans (strain T30-4) TaxID=403677 RepID=D0NCV0_PHYIT|nr:L-aminoadipate-semialdehyde dehydrogenase-phosphopantetheinyl transferase, putative [Phytophthora infestans T30-4]EEY55814.1 L-aminoadipate-semialdehyde dehydrogenase-phosphopantetheinyl transferase, putative [Phytophthora infestans T30-4]|eukprot:XP_002903390.1 L-aminoadipate-semialdehyde dehydrogenase-phosphopantetheinyl transferase, putative [Phytophthora infestans T30-4]
MQCLRFVDVTAWDLTSSEWRRLLLQLPDHEQKQVTRFMFAKDQKLALASRLLQRQLIHELFGVEYDTIDIARTPENKPYWNRLPGNPAPSSWNFNVSHHGTIVTIASDARSLVGVDVVRLTDRPHRKTSIEDFFRAFTGHFNPGEWEYIRGAEDEDRQYIRFYKLWSLKEAYIKAVGIGLGFSLLRAEFRCVRTVLGDVETRYKLPISC